MKKIAVIPGVGIFSDGPPNSYYIFDLLEKEFPGYEIEWCNWQHNLEIPKTCLPYKTAREWTCEVLLDYQMVLKHAMEVDIPAADYYIGHSAGSILALLQPRPSVICGSPAILVEDLQGIHPIDCMLNSQPVYNLVHNRDLLAYPFPFQHVENDFVDTDWWKLSNWEPISAHISYFRNKTLCKKIINKIKQWDKDGI